MSSLHRLVSLALISTLFVFVGAACSTGPDTEDDEVPIEETGAKDLIQTHDVLAAARIEPESLSTLSPLLQRLAQSVDDPQLRDFADMSPDPIGHLASRHNMPNELPSLDQEAASFVLFSHNGNEDFLNAALLGLPTQLEEWPTYFNVRLLLPTSSPENLRDELHPWLETMKQDGAISAHQRFEGPGFVRVELAVENTGPSGRASDNVDAQSWLENLRLQDLTPPSVAEFRPTPAYDAFVDGDSPFGVWSPLSAFSTMGAFELVDIFAADYHRIGPAGKPRYFLEGVARLSAASVVDDPVSAEHEDVSIMLSADAEETLLIDYYSTRTEQGVGIQEAMDGAVSLSGLNTTNPFLNLRGQFDLESVKEQAHQPYWSTLDSPSDFDEFDPDMGVENSVLPFSEDPTTFGTLTAGLQYPWTTASTASDTIGALVPLPRALAIDGFIPDSRQRLPLGAVAAAAFTDSPETRMAIEQLLSLAESAVPGALDAELIDRDDGLVELHLALGSDLAEAFAAEALEIGDGELSLNFDALGAMSGMMPGGQTMNLFDHVHIRGHAAQSYQTYRLTIGSPQAQEAVPVESRIEPRANPSERCQAKIAAASIEFLSDLRIDQVERVDNWARAVEERRNACIDPHNPSFELIEERIELGRQLVKDIP